MTPTEKYEAVKAALEDAKSLLATDWLGDAHTKINEALALLADLKPVEAAEQPEKDRWLTPCYGCGKTHLLSKGCAPYNISDSSELAIADDDGFDLEPIPQAKPDNEWSGLIRNPHLGIAPLPNDVCIDYGDLRKLIKAAERQPTPQPDKAEVVRVVANVLHVHTMKHSFFGFDAPLPLVDMLTPKDDVNIERGREELDHLAESICEVLSAMPARDDSGLVRFINEITTAGGKYSYLNDTPIVADAYAVLREHEAHKAAKGAV